MILYPANLSLRKSLWNIQIVFLSAPDTTIVLALPSSAAGDFVSTTGFLMSREGQTIAPRATAAPEIAVFPRVHRIAGWSSRMAQRLSVRPSVRRHPFARRTSRFAPARIEKLVSPLLWLRFPKPDPETGSTSFIPGRAMLLEVASLAWGVLWAQRPLTNTNRYRSSENYYLNVRAFRRHLNITNGRVIILQVRVVEIAQHNAILVYSNIKSV